MAFGRAARRLTSSERTAHPGFGRLADHYVLRMPSGTRGAGTQPTVVRRADDGRLGLPVRQQNDFAVRVPLLELFEGISDLVQRIGGRYVESMTR